MLSTIKIGNYNLSYVGNAEFVNPIEFEFKNQFDSMLTLIQSMADILPILKNIPVVDPAKSVYRIAVKNHLKDWKEFYDEVISTLFPENYFDFLLCRKKKIQNTILESFPLNTYTLHAIIFKAFKQYGFLYSTYFFEKNLKEYDHKIYPDLIVLKDDNTVDVVGNTNLSVGEMKSIIKNRTNVVAKFLDKGNIWHCFLWTWDSIKGKEVGNIPHIHYISSAFGKHITRESVLKELAKGKYNLESMIHIKYND